MASNIKVDIVRPTATNGSLKLRGDSGGSTTTNGVTVDNSGNVGIGTNSPSNNLEVVGDSDTNNTLAVFTASNSNNTIAVKRTTASQSYIALRAQANIAYVDAGPTFAINTTANDGSSPTERLRIDSSGNVEIPVSIKSDTINEKTNASGVTIDGVLLKDGTVIAGDGAEAAPSITNSGDTNTGIYFPSADNIAISTNSTQRMLISNTGDVTFSGSIAGGTIGSNVVFPTGHVIQTTQGTYNSGDSAISNSATTAKVVDASSNYHWSHTISGMTAGNDVLVNFSFVGAVIRSSTTAGGAWHIYRDDTIIYGSSSDFMQYIAATVATAVQDYSYINLVFLDTGATSASHTYYLGYSSNGGTTDVVVRSASIYPPFVAILQEIQS